MMMSFGWDPLNVIDLLDIFIFMDVLVWALKLVQQLKKCEGGKGKEGWIFLSFFLFNQVMYLSFH